MGKYRYLLFHELAQHIHSLKWLIMGGCIIVFSTASFLIQIRDYADRKSVYDDEMAKMQSSKHSATVFSQLEVPILIEPNPLSVFARGADGTVGNKIIISLMKLPVLQKTAQEQNPFMVIFHSFDLVSLVCILFSIFSLFLVADSIAGERENGTLRQIFSNSIPKSRFFACKFTGSLLTVAIPLTLLFLLCVLIILVHPAIMLHGAQWAGVAGIYVLCMLFLSAYVMAGLAISARCSSSATAAMAGVLVWVLLVFVLPNSIRYSVAHLFNVPSEDVIETQAADMKQEILKNVKASFPVKPGGPMSVYSYSTTAYGIPGLVDITQERYFSYFEACVHKGLPLILKGQQRVYSMLRSYKTALVRQQTLSGMINRLFPGPVLQRSAELLAGTHYSIRDIAYTEYAKQYREQFIRYVKSQGGFGLKFFSQINRADMKKEYKDYSLSDFDRLSRGSYQPLDFDKMPRFSLKHMHSRLSGVWVDIGQLILLNAILFILGGCMFIRSEIRNRS